MFACFLVQLYLFLALAEATTLMVQATLHLLITMACFAYMWTRVVPTPASTLKRPRPSSDASTANVPSRSLVRALTAPTSSSALVPTTSQTSPTATIIVASASRAPIACRHKPTVLGLRSRFHFPFELDGPELVVPVTSIKDSLMAVEAERRSLSVYWVMPRPVLLAGASMYCGNIREAAMLGLPPLAAPAARASAPLLLEYGNTATNMGTPDGRADLCPSTSIPGLVSLPATWDLAVPRRATMPRMFSVDSTDQIQALTTYGSPASPTTIIQRAATTVITSQDRAATDDRAGYQDFVEPAAASPYTVNPAGWVDHVPAINFDRPAGLPAIPSVGVNPDDNESSGPEAADTQGAITEDKADTLLAENEAAYRNIMEERKARLEATGASLRGMLFGGLPKPRAVPGLAEAMRLDDGADINDQADHVATRGIHPDLLHVAVELDKLDDIELPASEEADPSLTTHQQGGQPDAEGANAQDSAAKTAFEKATKALGPHGYKDTLAFKFTNRMSRMYGNVAFTDGDYGLLEWLLNFHSPSLCGGGAQGSVYRAFDVLTEREVAVKVTCVPPGACEPGHANPLEWAQNEVTILNELTGEEGACNNVVKYLAHRESDCIVALVTEYCGGGTLSKALKKGLFKNKSSKERITQELCRALAYVHDRGFVHLDLKPENILLTADGHVRLADFGLARLTNSTQTSFMGSLGYMSPEFLDVNGEKEYTVTRAMDTWSLAVVLLELFSGKKGLDCLTSLDNFDVYQLAVKEWGRYRECQDSDEAYFCSAAQYLKNHLRQPVLAKYLATVLSCRPEQRPSLQELSKCICAIDRHGATMPNLPKRLTTRTRSSRASSESSTAVADRSGRPVWR